MDSVLQKDQQGRCLEAQSQHSEWRSDLGQWEMGRLKAKEKLTRTLTFSLLSFLIFEQKLKHNCCFLTSLGQVSGLGGEEEGEDDGLFRLCLTSVRLLWRGSWSNEFLVMTFRNNRGPPESQGEQENPQC